MEPKAKWSAYDEDTKRIWTAAVGPIYLDVDSTSGTCEIAEWDPETADIGRTLWKHRVPTPCDVTDLMRLTEAELARRLVKVAETMEGGELVAPSTTVRVTFDPAVTSAERVDFGRRFHEAIATELAKVPAGWDVAETSVGATITKSAWPDLQQQVYDACHKRGIDTDDLEKLVNESFMAGGVTYSRADSLAGDAYWSMLLEAVDWYDERQSKTEPRFKVGDLVRSTFANKNSVGHIVGRAPDSLTFGAVWLVSVDERGPFCWTEDMFAPYTLPPINSYADLADVLDELPEGVVVEIGDAYGLRLYTRTSKNAYIACDSNDPIWTPSYYCNSRSQFELRGLRVRIRPPSEAATDR